MLVFRCELNCSTVGDLPPFKALNHGVALGGAQHCSSVSAGFIQAWLSFLSAAGKHLQGGDFERRRGSSLIFFTSPLYLCWCKKWRINFHDQMWFHFSLHWGWQNVLRGSHFGLEEALENWMRAKQFRYQDSEEYLQRSGCSSVMHWQVPLNSVVLLWFIPVTEVPCKLWVICLCCLCQVSKPVDLNFQ